MCGGGGVVGAWLVGDGQPTEGGGLGAVVVAEVVPAVAVPPDAGQRADVGDGVVSDECVHVGPL